MKYGFILVFSLMLTGCQPMCGEKGSGELVVTNTSRETVYIGLGAEGQTKVYGEFKTRQTRKTGYWCDLRGSTLLCVFRKSDKKMVQSIVFKGSDLYNESTKSIDLTFPFKKGRGKYEIVSNDSNVESH